MLQKRNEINTEFITEVLQTHWTPTETPGCFTENVRHPSGLNAAIEIGIVPEHRFAFFYWLKWHHKPQAQITRVLLPNLVTVDWHNDVGCSSDFIPEIINKLNYSNNGIKYLIIPFLKLTFMRLTVWFLLFYLLRIKYMKCSRNIDLLFMSLFIG